MMKLRELLGKRLLLLDGGLGTQLQLRGLGAGELPELWNIIRPDDVLAIHNDYLAAGSDMVMTNTFGATALRYPDNLEAVVTAGVSLARQAAVQHSTIDKPRFVALDLGPTGRLLRPMGDLDFEDCVALYSQVVRLAVAAGVDAVAIETMTDLYESKAAVLAVKESCDLPVYVTITPDPSGKLLTGGSLASAVALLEGLRVDALGLNCGLGPVQLLPMVRELAELSSLPLVVKPNAGLPVNRDGKVCYDIDADGFTAAMAEVVSAGAWAVGGCCGTTPDYIARLRDRCGGIVPPRVIPKCRTVVSGSTGVVTIGGAPVVIGERINPTGKKRFKQALLDNDIDYVLGEGIKQQDSGAQILDVNVGMPEIDEAAMLARVVAELQGVTGLPLQLDTASPDALACALRRCNGKPLINSTSGKRESMEAVFPLAAKYGGVVVGLTLDEAGIPATVEGRLAIALRIISTAALYGIDRKDIIIDPLTMTIATETQGAAVTLTAVERLRNELGVNTVLSVSNISFGLPRRELISSTFLALALGRGLSAAIVNPGSTEMMAAYRSYLTLAGHDPSGLRYIEAYAGTAAGGLPTVAGAMTLGAAVERGLRDSAVAATRSMLGQGTPSLDIIETQLVPALDAVGRGFEQRSLFLPQLMLSADAAKAAFAVISDAMLQAGTVRRQRGTILLATVKGDIHDIGKNIVKVLLENYGYRVVDMGKDVAPQLIVQTVQQQGITLVGLSALMTTTVGAMEETIALLHAAAPDCRVMVGGAVLTQDYADSIGADNYSVDAMASVRYANQIFGERN